MKTFVKIVSKHPKILWSWYTCPLNGAGLIVGPGENEGSMKVQILHSGHLNTFSTNHLRLIVEKEAAEIRNHFLQMDLEERDRYIFLMNKLLTKQKQSVSATN